MIALGCLLLVKKKELIIHFSSPDIITSTVSQIHIQPSSLSIILTISISDLQFSNFIEKQISGSYFLNFLDKIGSFILPNCCNQTDLHVFLPSFNVTLIGTSLWLIQQIFLLNMNII